MSEPLPVVADIPTEAPGLGFPEYVDAVADAIRGGQPPQFTIGIYGLWGSGKSSILRSLERNLREGHDVIPVYFDAWRYEQTEHIVVPLLHHIVLLATFLFAG
jgi:KaiC/GvpD/RAD55 family RecA-like ATPase